MNGVPVANRRQDEQQERYQQQAGCLRRINCVPGVLAVSVVLALRNNHEHIVRRVIVLNYVAKLRVVDGPRAGLKLAVLVLVLCRHSKKVSPAESCGLECSNSISRRANYARME